MVSYKKSEYSENKKYIKKAFRAFQINSFTLDVKTAPKLTDEFLLEFKGDSKADSDIEDFINLFCKAFNGLPVMYRKIIWLTEIEMIKRIGIALEFNRGVSWLRVKSKLSYKEFADALR